MIFALSPISNSNIFSGDERKEEREKWFREVEIISFLALIYKS